jgi:RimJ/RimL family protein N-acetyltransferase
LITTDKDLVGPWIAQELDMVWTPENSTAIGWIEEGELVAGVWYEDYNRKSVTCHIVLKKPINRKFLAIIFDYPFIQLGVSKIIGPVKSDNVKAIEFDKKLGFKEEARILDAFPNADLIFFVMNKDECRFLGERYGKVL